MKRIHRLLIVLALLLCHTVPTRAQQAAEPGLSGRQLLTEVQHRAFLFFWEQTDPTTGLTKDRAHNAGDADGYTVASTASTGYALASLPVAVSHHWIDQQRAYSRALTTLMYVQDKLPQIHGWYYHFVDWHTGQRVWNSEASTIDTTLLIEGALMVGSFWHGTELEKIADRLNERLDWTWMLTNGGAQPNKLLVCMGWKPESGFLNSNWDRYCELLQLYLLGLSSRSHPLPTACWAAWERNEISYGGLNTLAGGPIFFHEMSHLFFDFKDQRDSLGWDYWISGKNGVEINRRYCRDLNQSKTGGRKSYGDDFWGINANDAPPPVGYHAYAAPGDEDGTVSPTGVIAADIFLPNEVEKTADAMYSRLQTVCWGRYGFGNAFNLDKNWFDKDVLGIDLGMALLAIEDARTGLPWKLLAAHKGLQHALTTAGFHKTNEATRSIRKTPRPRSHAFPRRHPSSTLTMHPISYPRESQS